MDRTELDVYIATPPERTFALWVDAARFPQWQRGLESVTEASGPLGRPGTTYVLRAGPKMEMRAEVLEATTGQLHRVRARGVRTVQSAEARFEPDGGGTRLRVSYELELKWGWLSRIAERLSRGSSRGEFRREVENFKRFAERPDVQAKPGSWYSLDDGGGHFRLGQVFAASETAVHLQLRPGVWRERPTSLDARVGEVPILRDPADFKPLSLSIRATAQVLQAGQRLLLVDGGLGIDHLPMTPGAFSDARPEAVSAGTVAEDMVELVDGWARSGAPVYGREIGLRLTPLVSLANEDGSFGVAKILHASWREVHLRIYADSWSARPTSVNPWTLELGSVDMERIGDPTYEMPSAIGVGHLPLTRVLYQKGDPELVKLVTLQPNELDGYREWKTARGGVFG